MSFWQDPHNEKDCDACDGFVRVGNTHLIGNNYYTFCNKCNARWLAMRDKAVQKAMDTFCRKHYKSKE